MKITQIKQKIMDAFPSIEPPRCPVTQFWDASVECEDTVIHREITGKKWQEINPQTIIRLECAEGLFSRLAIEHFIYLIPAFLMTILESLDESDVMSDHFFYLIVDIKDNSNDHTLYREAFESLSDFQLEVVLDCLKYFTHLWPDDKDLKQAINVFDEINPESQRPVARKGPQRRCDC